jgi:hypothetical protein
MVLDLKLISVYNEEPWFHPNGYVNAQNNSGAVLVCDRILKYPFTI